MALSLEEPMFFTSGDETNQLSSIWPLQRAPVGEKAVR